jgi:oligosaccharyltransferase complex subunit alpha (ribophorin I)
VNAKNASDTVFYKIDTKAADQSGKGVFSITVREIYKRRKEAFPAKISIREELSLRFIDSKYYISVYPTKTQKYSI